MKKIALCVLIVSLVFCTSSAFAGWGNYYVVAAGPYENPTLFPEIGKIMSVQMKPVGGSTVTFFRLDSTIQNELLAVALSCVSTGQPVRANIGHNYSNGHWSDYEVITLWIYDSESSLP